MYIACLVLYAEAVSNVLVHSAAAIFWMSERQKWNSGIKSGVGCGGVQWVDVRLVLRLQSYHSMCT
jgi:hypothetical protein